MVFNTLSVWKVEVAGKEIGPSDGTITGGNRAQAITCTDSCTKYQQPVQQTKKQPARTRKEKAVAEPVDDINGPDSDKLPF